MNPLRCDCNLRWIKKAFSQNPVGLRCATPDLLAGRRISALEAKDFVCDDGVTLDYEDAVDAEDNSVFGFGKHYELRLMRLLVVVFGMLSLFFIGLAIVAFVQRERLLAWSTNRKRGTGSIYYVKAKPGPRDEEI